jgi:hypothetical protein
MSCCMAEGLGIQKRGHNPMADLSDVNELKLFGLAVSGGGVFLVVGLLILNSCGISLLDVEERLDQQEKAQAEYEASFDYRYSAVPVTETTISKTRTATKVPLIDASEYLDRMGPQNGVWKRPRNTKEAAVQSR